MKFFIDLKIKNKLIVIFTIICIFILSIGAEGIIGANIINKNSNEIYSNNIVSIRNLQSLKANLYYDYVNMVKMTYEGDKSKIKDEMEIINNIVSKNEKLIKEYEDLNKNQEEEKLFSDFKNDLYKYRELKAKSMEFLKSEKYDEALEVYNSEITPILTSMFDKLEKSISINDNLANESNIENSKIFRGISIMTLISTILIFGFIIFIAYVLSKNIINPLNKIGELAKRLSEYDFSIPITITRKDEFGDIGIALNTAQDNVNNLVRIIMENSEDISASSEELSATAQELLSKTETIDEAVNNISLEMQESSATSEQISASVQEVDASINVLSSTALDGSNNANSSKERALEVKNNSEKAIAEMVKIYDEKKSKMQKAIEESEVVQTIKVMADTISGIAEQTNLLALNAAIEAARAGEQGKGFAVVAEEVRKLAEESKSSALIIQETILKVQNAFKSSIETGNDILEFINKNVYEQFKAYKEAGNQYYDDSDIVSKMSDEIASMSEEVTATVGQVSEAVQNMAEASQKTSEGSFIIKESMDETTKAIEQVALTAQSQAELAQRLNEMIQKFKV